MQRHSRERRAPLHLCALTLTRHKHPVASPDGTVFESSTILQLVRRTGLNPITGRPLTPESLTPLSFSTDPRTSLPRCPILFRSFNENIKIVAVATSGNVYSFAAVQRHNIQPGNMTDLIDRTPFTADDLIVLFDPQQHVWSTHLQDPPLSTPLSQPQLRLSNASLPSISAQPTRYHIPPREPPAHRSPTMPMHSLSPLTDTSSAPAPSVQTNVDSLLNRQPCFPNTSSQISLPNLPSPSSQPIRSNQLPLHIHPTPIIHPPAYPPTPSPFPSLSPHNHFSTKRTVQKRLQPSPIPKRPRLHPAVLPPSSNGPTRPVSDKKLSTTAYYDRKRAEEERKAVYKRIRKGRKGKGYVRVVTNIGHLNIELHCDRVPMTCDNFLSLAEAKYYDGLRWHRVVPGFIAQTGDPSGTGEGGDSFWGGFFKDEIRTSLRHEGPGIVSMASSGRDTNLSQWFICLDAAPHLDGSHTVFGKVVGGLFVLSKIESEAEMGHPLTVEKIEVLVNPIRQAREQLEKETLPKQLPSADRSTTPSNSQTSSAPSTKSNTLNGDQTQAAPVSLPIHTKHPAILPQPRPPNPYTNRPSHAVQENLPPARTLLSAADIPPKHM